MSDFYNPHECRTARKSHQCTYCAEEIDAGAEYAHQTGVYEGRWYTNKMHPECFEDMCGIGNGEFTPYSNDRPQITAATAAQGDAL